MTDGSQLRVGVIGMGPVGSVLSAHLIKAGAFVVPCDIWEERINHIREHGIQLKNTIEFTMAVEQAVVSPAQLAEYDLDIICISVKTAALKPVLEALKSVVKDDTRLMCTQNGIDNELDVAQAYGADRVLRMVLNYAGSLDGQEVNVTFFNPPNYIGSMTPASGALAERFTALLNSVDLTTSVDHDEIDNHIWRKAILNAAMSSVTALTGKTMKEVMDFEPTAVLVELLITESVQVAEAEGIHFEPGFRRHAIRYLKKAGHHKPSLLVDLENDRITEIGYLNGKIEEYGAKHFVPTPLNRALTSMITLIESLYPPKE